MAIGRKESLYAIEEWYFLSVLSDATVRNAVFYEVRAQIS
jgi:hypothetical protein